jgi:hypothetical protein
VNLNLSEQSATQFVFVFLFFVSLLVVLANGFPLLCGLFQFNNCSSKNKKLFSVVAVKH